MNKLDFKISLFLSFICFISGFFVLPYQLDILQRTLPNQYDEFIGTIPLPINLLILVTSFQLFFISFGLSLIGIKLARKTGFSLNIFTSLFNKEKVSLNKKSVLLSVIFGVFIALIISGADRFYYQYQIPLIRENTPEFSFLALLVGVLYGGFFEEILLRLFFMSLLIWIFQKIFNRNKSSLNNKYYWIAIVISAALFAAGHLPATEMLFGELSTNLIVRCFLLNGTGGLLFGYLYWKKGFEYAVLAHMVSHISLQLLFIPLFY
ncbi:CPBP family intramembrane glutamic endopeptidase [Chengkuizengella marina]|uniref:CPBP family intramembrane metalloprotease n=1 Tax=Chengkuizengella marina TaxID=2507566 RepID=A0A6N9Q6A4_9BACL|nr:CPBP family intramembrane glutamic endopeptidase [Chengkuizengella marina]NBI30231.1 CPBP family intramembrane metalloprotease [Chengkuizengella marina]